MFGVNQRSLGIWTCSTGELRTAKRRCAKALVSFDRLEIRNNIVPASSFANVMALCYATICTPDR